VVIHGEILLGEELVPQGAIILGELLVLQQQIF
jgi:hypothetical protein